MIAPALTTGCLIYGLAALLFSLCILALTGLGFAAYRTRRRALGHLNWRARLAEPTTPAERHLRRRGQKVFFVALLAFGLGAFVDTQGPSLGLFADRLDCPAPWPDPRSLRTLRDAAGTPDE
ncbi:MAG: hypothetical protein AAF484_09940 [Pseudomonadota bacterium]